jgi:hypothetical protein
MLCALGCGLHAAARADTFYVNSTSNAANTPNECANVPSTDIDPSGPGDTCTLRDALDAVTSAETAAPGGDNTISFIVCGPFVVSGTELPPVPANTEIDAGLVANASCSDTGPNGGSPNSGYANIEGSDGSGGSAGFPGLAFKGAGSFTSGGLIIGGFTNGIVLGPPGGDHIYYDGIGANPFEQGDLVPENTGNGIEVDAGSADDIIGSPGQASNDQDDIYGNGGWGVYLEPGSGPTTIGHNFIGTDTSGHMYGPGGDGYAGSPGDGTSDGNALGGVYVGDSSGDLIGGDTPCTYVGDSCNSNVIGNNGGPGVEIAKGASGATVAGNYIGMSLNFYNDPATDGDAPAVGTPGSVCPEPATASSPPITNIPCPLPNTGPGILDEGSDDTIGGGTAGAANLVSSNAGPGIELEGSHANVENNLIGMTFDGSAAQGNSAAGVLASDAAAAGSGSNRIAGNVIGGNTGPGIQLDQPGNTIVSNYVGTAADKSSPLPNSIGILARRSNESIGGAVAGGNVIAHNIGAGIAVVDAPGSSTPTTGVAIYRNSIFGNTGLGIDLGDDGVTPNHATSPSLGPNDWQNFPIITSASVANGQYSIHGTLDGVPDDYYSINVFGNSQCDPSGYGQGQTVVSGGTVSTDASGHANWVITGTGLAPGTVLSALAVSGFDQSTSEFGPCTSAAGGVDLAVSQTVHDGGKVIADEPVDLDIRISNKGSTGATGITVTDTVSQGETIASQPAGCPSPSGGSFTCTLGKLAAGSSEDVQVIVNPGSQPTLTNTVTAGADQVQTNANDNVSDFAAAVSANPGNPGPPGPITEPTPTFGHYVRLNREAGTVTATLPNGQSIQLKKFALVPVGTVVQATNGDARVTAGLPKGVLNPDVSSKGKAAHESYADFRYGRFVITQPRGRGGLVDAKMNEPLSGCTARALRTALASRHKPRKRRRLWGHAHGKFTITGNRGAATVHGTIWEVIDTCTTTTVIDYTDVVTVVGFGNTVPKHATLTPGHRVVLRAG